MRIAAFDFRGVISRYTSSFDDAQPNLTNIAEIQNWVMEGWVPSLVATEGQDTPPFRLFLEMWATKHNVPYSNLLVGVDDEPLALRWIDASFYVIADATRARNILENNPNVRVYVCCPFLEVEKKKFLEDSRNQPILDRVFFAKTLKEVTDIEKKESWNAA